MAKKKGLYGVSNYVKNKPRKRPGRIRKKVGPGKQRPKKYRGQGRWEISRSWQILKDA